MIKSFQRQGFTLVELLVSITVIAILATIVTIGFETYLADARDKRRAADITNIAASVEKYYLQNGEYPYTGDMNPTAAMGQLPSYGPVLELLKGLSSDSLGSVTGSNFWAIRCLNCSSTPEELKERAKQYIYFSAARGTSSNTLQYPYSSTYPYLWGCKVTTNDTEPGFMLAWRSEIDGKWTFHKGQHGQITIEDYGATRPPGQVCAWS